VNDTDERLLERLATGDEAAFETLFVRHYGLVYRVLYGLVGSREEAEDLAQETMLALYTHRPRLQAAGGGLPAWLSRVALNRGYNALRSAQRARQRTDKAASLEPPASQDDPHSAAVRAEERASVQAAIGKLPPRQGQLLLLRYAGLSYAEIAAALDIAPGSVGTLLARAERAFLKTYQPFVAGVVERGTV
jgi:RNA polymerase sigma-70 factor (ECF subfamily)